jgi:hypothetical protein
MIINPPIVFIKDMEPLSILVFCRRRLGIPPWFFDAIQDGGRWVDVFHGMRARMLRGVAAVQHGARKRDGREA